MGNTLDMNKIKEDHQARTKRIYEAFFKERDSGDEEGVNFLTNIWEWAPCAIADALTEIAAIWREEAQRLSDIVEPKPRGWKSTMESYKDCATRLSAVAVAMRTHGLPGDAGPKERPAMAAETSTASPALVDGAAQAAGDAGPKESTDSPLPTKSPAIPTSASAAKGSTTETAQTAHPSDDPAGDFLRDLGRAPNGLVDKVHEESLADAASAIIEQVRAKDLLLPGEVFMNSGGILDTSNLGEAHLTLQWNDNLGAPRVRVLPEGHDVQIIPGSFSIGAADAPPAWSAQPAVPVFELDSPMALEPPAHVSVSQANEAAECGLKRKLNKRHGAPSAPGWALVGGKAVHACIDRIEAAYADSQGLGVSIGSDIAHLWRQCFHQAIEQTELENPLFPKATWHASKGGKENEAWWNADGPEMVHHYLEWRAKWRAQGWVLLHTADGRPVVEMEFLVFIGGVMVKGFIDSAWYHPARNMIAILDWKSGSSKPADYFQQATYRHALEPLVPMGAGETAPKWLGAFWDARSGDLGPLVDLDVRHPRAEVEMRLSLPRRLDAAGIYMPNVNTGYGGCGSCSLKRSCPVGSRIGKGEVKL